MCLLNLYHLSVNSYLKYYYFPCLFNQPSCLLESFQVRKVNPWEAASFLQAEYPWNH